MQLLRQPNILRLPPDHIGNERYLFIIESNGQDPKQRDGRRAAYKMDAPCPGTIWRADIVVPAKHTNDPEYIVLAFRNAMNTMLDAFAKKKAPATEGAEFFIRTAPGEGPECPTSTTESGT